MFEGDPIAAAEEFTLGGAKWLHVVDLDLAFTGTQENLQTISLLARVSHVSVDRVGDLAGPDLDGVSRTAFRTQRSVIASGGVASAEDIRALASFGPLVQGAILGRALYDGGITVREAVRAAVGGG